MFVNFFSFFIIIFSVFSLFGYRECLNSDEITENCLSEIFIAEDYLSFVRFSDSTKYKDAEKKLIQKAFSLYKLGRYEEFDSLLEKFPGEMKNTLFFKYLRLETYFARKRFSQALDLLNDIKDNSPVFFVEQNLFCMEADIMHSRKHYDEAVTLYETCVENGKNPIASYRRLVSMEKNGLPRAVYLSEYLEYAETYRFSFLSDKILDRLIYLKEKHNFPTPESAYFNRWFSVMKREKMLEKYFKDSWADINDTLKYQVVLYLKENEHYDKALSIIEKQLENHKTNKTEIYRFGWQKFRVLYEYGKIKEALSYLEELSENLNGSQKERAIFFLGIINFEEKNFERSEILFRDIVFSHPESKYFMLALYKLGLQYIYTGQDILMYRLWAEYIYSFDLAPWKYYFGRTVFSTMRQLFLYKDKTLGFYNFSSPVAVLCEKEGSDENKSGVGVSYLSYYDIAYAHNIDGCMDKKRKTRGMDKEHIELWEKNLVNYRDDYVGKIRENIQKIPLAIRSEEPFVMINKFNEAGLLSGMTFYARYIKELYRYSKQENSEVPEIIANYIDNPDAADRVDSLWSNAVRYLLRDVYLLTGQHAKAINIHYNNVRKNLTFSPSKGLEKDWSFLYPTPYWETVKKLSVQFDISPALMYSIMRAETFFRKELVSPVGALGLMQVMPYTFEKISVRSGIKIANPLDPYDSMKAAAWYLNKLMMRFNDNIMPAVAAYNAGPHRVSEWLKRFGNVDAVLFSELIPFGETRRYVKKVLRYYEIYSYLYENRFYDIQLREKISTEENPIHVDF